MLKLRAALITLELELKLELVLVLLLAACAHAPPPPSPPHLPWYGDLHALAAEAAAARAVPLTQAFEVIALSDEAFFAARGSIDGSLHLDEAEGTLREFTGVTDGRAHLSERDLKTVRDEQVLAFYDFTTHRLFVRETPPTEGAHLFATAHEVGHVLQDQLGVGVRRPATLEEAVAQRAVLEGDASLTATLVDAQRRHLPAALAVERARVAWSVLTPRQLLEATGSSRALLEASPLVRELFVFPYLHGQRFVFDLFQAGGEALVRSAVLEAPTRSDAVHAPQRWLDGSPRLEPVGVTPRRLGLFLTRLLLAQCEARNAKAAELGRWVEAHYVDDSFHRAGATLSWATTWDTAPHPVDVALELEAGERELDADALRWRNERLRAVVPTVVLACLGASLSDVDVRVSGEVVGVVLHAPSADRERVVTRVARTALTRDAPRGTARIEPPAQRAVGKGTVRGTRWTHEQLGLALSLEGGSIVTDPSAELVVTGRGAALVVVFIDDEPGSATIDAVLDARLAAQLALLNGDARLPVGTRHPWTARAGGALETRGELEGPLVLHAVQLPRLGGTVLIITTAQHTSGQALINHWLNNLPLPVGRGSG